MMWSEFLLQLLELLNEILTAGIAIIAASMLLYNLSRRSQNRVTRTSSILLAAVTLTFLGDVALSLGPPMRPSIAMWLRFQWVGIAFVPAALFHLSDALLATTGRISRWRRRLGVRVLYGLGAAFMIAAALTDQVVQPLALNPAPHLRGGPWLPVYMVYALSASALALYNVYRARQRCLTFSTRRRMTYMLFSILTPLVGVLPYTSLINGAPFDGVSFWLLANLNNVAVILMLSFMAYPLSFFGSEVPDRVIKAELMEFFLRGPFVGIAVLAVMIGMPRAGDVLGLPGREITPVAAIASLIFLQWAISQVLPTLKDLLIYKEDREEMQRIRELSERLLTRSDLEQMLEGILTSVCDYVRAPAAFVASSAANTLVIEQAVGARPADSPVPDPGSLAGALNGLLSAREAGPQRPAILSQGDLWLIPLWNGDNGNGRTLIGVMGIHRQGSHTELLAEEQATLYLMAEQAARVLQDLRLQAELAGYIEGLMPRVEEMDQLRWVTRFREEPMRPTADPDFTNKVKDALTHYWGGPRLTQSELLNLHIVQEEQQRGNSNPAQALRAVLLKAVESLRPEGERSMTAAEWTLYNILEMRFIQGRKVRDAARRLAMSESDFYRKQRTAIDEVARVLLELEMQHAAQ